MSLYTAFISKSENYLMVLPLYLSPDMISSYTVPAFQATPRQGMVINHEPPLRHFMMAAIINHGISCCMRKTSNGLMTLMG